MIRRPPRSTLSSSSAASDVYKRQLQPPHHLNNDTIITRRSLSSLTLLRRCTLLAYFFNSVAMGTWSMGSISLSWEAHYLALPAMKSLPSSMILLTDYPSSSCLIKALTLALVLLVRHGSFSTTPLTRFMMIYRPYSGVSDMDNGVG
eukprot:TRINITY_DN23167_c0_g1_i1.p1 TRINITY_DN23167_c0_g1~~TRINITY_DN23167_c0_g1_i1.p1  ORF type:complete len:147 (-),score=1.79 TRINITY_DN23167_c0_g1_i1:18-458(-)